MPDPIVKVVIPAQNEERAIGKVISEIPDWVSEVVFLDGDASDYPEDMSLLVQPIRDDEADMVIGSRVLGELEKGSLTPQQRFGNSLACWLMKLIWKHTYTDLGPFRAISREGLEKLNMEAPTFGWTVEMQIRAANVLENPKFPAQLRVLLWRVSISSGRYLRKLLNVRNVLPLQERLRAFRCRLWPPR